MLDEKEIYHSEDVVEEMKKWIVETEAFWQLICRIQWLLIPRLWRSIRKETQNSNTIFFPYVN
jgi:hypothetical protein